jgi:hypothetical protein
MEVENQSIRSKDTKQTGVRVVSQSKRTNKVRFEKQNASQVVCDTGLHRRRSNLFC